MRPRSGVAAAWPRGEPERDHRPVFHAPGVQGGWNATGRRKPLHRSSGSAILTHAGTAKTEILIHEYFEREVKPRVPDTWINENKTKVG